MAYYRVEKTYTYTETVYIEAENAFLAEDISVHEEGCINYDDTWHESNAIEITKEEYESEVE